jgi:hypothetical protein
MHAVKSLTDDKIILVIHILTIEFKPENYTCLITVSGENFCV